MDSMMTCQLASWQRLSDPGLSKLSASSVGSKDALGTSKFGQHAAWADGWLVCSRLGVARAGMTKGEPAAAVFVPGDESLPGMDVIRAFGAVDYFIQVLWRGR